MYFEFINDPKAPYGFLVKPKYLKTIKIEAKMHLDTSYVRIIIEIVEKYINYLFDKERNYISWEEREKDVKNMLIEVKILPFQGRIFTLELNINHSSGKPVVISHGFVATVWGVEVKEHYVNVDTGCYLGKNGYNQLSAYCVETGEVVSMEYVS